MAELAEKHQPLYANTNAFPMADGKTLHMDLGFGDLANRVLTVGSENRAEKIAKFLDPTPAIKVIRSSRGFTTYTGNYQGVQVSIVAIGMGLANMDFLVRESRAIVHGPMIMVRFGTCGGLSDSATAGSITVCSEGSAFINRNPDAFSGESCAPYTIHKIVPADSGLAATIVSSLKDHLKLPADGSRAIVEGVNMTADFFYASQGRIDDRFDDQNVNLIAAIHARHPHVVSMEMETFQLLHLAQCSKIPIKACAAAIVVANRKSDTVVEDHILHEMEREGGRAVLHAIAHAAL